MECLKTLRLGVLSEAGVRFMACPPMCKSCFFRPAFGLAAIAARHSLRPIAQPMYPPSFIAIPRTNAWAFLVELGRHRFEPPG